MFGFGGGNICVRRGHIKVMLRSLRRHGHAVTQSPTGYSRMGVLMIPYSLYLDSHVVRCNVFATQLLLWQSGIYELCERIKASSKIAIFKKDAQPKLKKIILDPKFIHNWNT